jgi:hypothetical protein
LVFISQVALSTSGNYLSTKLIEACPQSCLHFRGMYSLIPTWCLDITSHNGLAPLHWYLYPTGCHIDSDNVPWWSTWWPSVYWTHGSV